MAKGKDAIRVKKGEKPNRCCELSSAIACFSAYILAVINSFRPHLIFIQQSHVADRAAQLGHNTAKADSHLSQLIFK